MPLVCVPGAIENRPRYNELRRKLLGAIVSKQTHECGQSWELSENEITFAEAAEWIAMERLCCPFLTFELEPGHHLSITGPEGTADFLKREFEN